MNPPTDTRYRVLRGGSWNILVRGPSRVRAASRNAREPAYRSGNIGFRCALPVRQPRV